MYSDPEFAQCSALTSIALEHGTPIDECVDEGGRNLLGVLVSAIGVTQMQPDQRIQVLRYFQWLGVDIEHRDNEGKTPLLAAIANDDHCLGFVSAYLEANANLEAVDNLGRGYLRIALERSGILFGYSSCYDLDYQSELLVTLLSADPRFQERAITPSETPRLIELAFSVVAWDVWTWVFEKLNWDMEEMNAYRYAVLQEPLKDGLAPYEEARIQMLGQTGFRLGRAKTIELKGAYFDR